jgi:alpha-L-arabinofuranosidase
VFAGEYAAQSDKTVSINNRNNWRCALAEAAFMTGLERNAAVVVMASYAPLFAHVDAWQWTPDLIWFDNLRSYGTPNYYVQKLFSVNKGTQVVPITLNNDVIAGQDGLYASSCIDKNKRELIIKLVNASEKVKSNEIKLTGIKKSSSQVKITILQSNDLEQCNSLDNPTTISPIDKIINLKGDLLKIDLQPYSFTILQIDN